MSSGVKSLVPLWFHCARCEDDPPLELRKRTYRGGSVHAALQCLMCWRQVGQNISKRALKEAGVEADKPFDDVKLKEENSAFIKELDERKLEDATHDKVRLVDASLP